MSKESLEVWKNELAGELESAMKEIAQWEDAIKINDEKINVLNNVIAKHEDDEVIETLKDYLLKPLSQFSDMIKQEADNTIKQLNTKVAMLTLVISEINVE